MPSYIPLRGFTQKERIAFWNGLDRTGGVGSCWPWQRSKDGNGYGKLKVGARTIRAHRIAYFLANDTDPAEMMVCHRCDNPPCCNPDHLWLGTNADNMNDAFAKGRKKGRPQQGERNGNASLTKEDVEAIRAMLIAGKTNIFIAAKFNVSHAMISRIRRGKAWGGEPIGERYESCWRNTDKVA